MNIKLIAISWLLILVFGLSSKGVVAAPAATSSARKAALTVAQQTAQQNRATNLINRANQEINRRLTSLNNLLTLISSVKRLSGSEKSPLTDQVQNEITNLTSLQSKIDADTDLTTLKIDVQSIIKSYRVYALFVPKIHLIVIAEEIIDGINQLNTNIVAKLEFRINKDKTAGKNTTSLETSLADMKAKLIDAQAQAQKALDILIPLTPDGYPGNKTQLQMARNSLRLARQDLNTARQDARTIIQGLKKLEDSPKTNKVSPSVTSNGKQNTGATSSGRILTP